MICVTKCPLLRNRPSIQPQHLCSLKRTFFAFGFSLSWLLWLFMPVVQITSQMPNHPANSFYYPRLRELPPIASIRVTRQSRSPGRQAPMSNHILPNIISRRISGELLPTWERPVGLLLLLMVFFFCTSLSETPLDCEVSLWSSWGLCLGPCSRGGVRHRTRYILLQPANAGTPCPELEEQAECVPYSCMKRQ